MDVLQSCQVCAGLIDEEDLFCSNCGKSVDHAASDVSATNRGRMTHSFDCSGCGSTMSYDAKVQNLRCPYCNSERLNQRNDDHALEPSKVIPFELRRENALKHLTHWLGRGFWRPGNLASSASISKVQSVYVPFWIFSASVHTYWTADSGSTPIGARGDWYPVTGENRNTYEGVTVGASSVLTPSETAAICPFDFSKCIPFEQLDVEHANIEQFTVPRKYARPLARQGLEESEQRSCAERHLPSSYRNLKVNVRIEKLRSFPAVLPVWVMAYTYRQRLYRILINGQTGKVVGAAPFSWLKLIVVLMILAIVVIAVFALTSL